jgi:hypothetical protein
MAEVLESARQAGHAALDARPAADQIGRTAERLTDLTHVFH